MRQILFLNPEHATDAEVASYPVRRAARAVVLDGGGKIALLHASRHGYYKLPGGGIENDEDVCRALQRECLEEIGTAVETTIEIGDVVEYRKFCALKQISHCYLARAVGARGATSLTEDEKLGGIEAPVWVTIEEAIHLLVHSKSSTLEGREYIVPRDIAILKEAQKHL